MVASQWTMTWSVGKGSVCSSRVKNVCIRSQQPRRTSVEGSIHLSYGCTSLKFETHHEMPWGTSEQTQDLENHPK